jgi:hypothetical protein
MACVQKMDSLERQTFLAEGIPIQSKAHRISNRSSSIYSIRR